MGGPAGFEEVDDDSHTSISSTCRNEHKHGQENVLVSKFAVGIIDKFSEFILSFIEFVNLLHSLIIASSDLDSLSEMSVPMLLLCFN